MVGRVISHYAIQEKLGEGGMGVVYRALDRRLNRNVAIKFLRSDAVADPERKKRFVQEARAASALNHPNIVTIFDIDTTDDGSVFMSMEFVAGKTLAVHIGRKGLPVEKALHYAVQIADALAAAHASGIIHRDLKPGNVMITDKGSVKLLDFGLAKLTEPAEADADDDEGLTRTLKQEIPATGKGTVLGTAAYMSPEQAQGLPLDARSDIFSFGAVLYEMVTGRRAFDRGNRASTVSSILRDEPRLDDVDCHVPPELERTIRRCLRKDREKRIQHISDLKLHLEDLKEDSESGRLAAASHATRRRRPAWLILGLAIGCVAIGIAASWVILRGRPSGPEPAISALTSDAGYSGQPAISADGKLLAFTSDRGDDGFTNIWVKQVPAGEPIQITHVHRAGHPDFSPDGTRIVYEVEDDHSVYVVPALGGTPRRIASSGIGPRFSPDGNSIAYVVEDKIAYQDSIRVVPSGGGSGRVVAVPLRRVAHVIWSHDGRQLLAMGTPATSGWLQTEDPSLDWWVVPLDSSKPEATGILPKLRASGAGWRVPDVWLKNLILFTGPDQAHRMHVWRLPVDSAGRSSGEPVRLTSNTAEERFLSWSRSGLAAFESLNYGVENLWLLPLSADEGKAAGALERVTRTAASDENPAVSQDGRVIAFQSDRAGNQDIWLKDFETGKELQLTNTPVQEGRPAISPDGLRVAYTLLQSVPRMMSWVLPADGGNAEPLCEDCGEVRGWFPDGRQVLLNGKPNTPEASVDAVDIASRRVRTIVAHAGLPLGRGRVSPDGRWVAFEAIPKSNTRQVFIAPVRDTPADYSEWVPVTDGKQFENKPEWSPNGKWIYYVSQRDGYRCIWARAFEPMARAVRGEPTSVLHLHASEISIQPLNWTYFDISVARDKLVFNAVESRANVQAIRIR